MALAFGVRVAPRAAPRSRDAPAACQASSSGCVRPAGVPMRSARLTLALAVLPARSVAAAARRPGACGACGCRCRSPADTSCSGAGRRTLSVSAGATTEEGEANPAGSEPARVVVVTSGKGGVGKTTSTANIGSACPTHRLCVLAAMRPLTNAPCPPRRRSVGGAPGLPCGAHRRRHWPAEPGPAAWPGEPRDVHRHGGPRRRVPPGAGACRLSCPGCSRHSAKRAARRVKGFCPALRRACSAFRAARIAFALPRGTGLFLCVSYAAAVRCVSGQEGLSARSRPPARRR